MERKESNDFSKSAWAGKAATHHQSLQWITPTIRMDGQPRGTHS
jgi:hypothetical protein